jgi:hypothetical protein
MKVLHFTLDSNTLKRYCFSIALMPLMKLSGDCSQETAILVQNG